MSPDRLRMIGLDVIPEEGMQITAFMQTARLFLNPLSPVDSTPEAIPGYVNTVQRQMPALEQAEA